MDEGASSCVMYYIVWKNLGFLDLVPLTITLRAFNNQPLSIRMDFFQPFIKLARKTILIDVEVVDDSFNCNTLH
jgi:hypothetical protein